MANIFRKFLLLTFTILLLMQPLFASGKKDNGFETIDKLIEIKDYNAALYLLEEYIKDNPKDFDNAQKRISKIMEAREGYSSLAKQLIDILNNEPENDEKQLNMISELEAMETNPNATALSFLKQTKSAAQFTYYRSQFEKIMQEGKDLYLAGKLQESAEKFQSGFQLYQNEYFANNYDSQYVTPVREGLATITSSVSSFSELLSTLKNSIAAYETTLQSGTYANAQAAYNDAETAINAYAQMRNNVATIGETFHNLFTELQKTDPELTEASFLPFAYRFALGRANDTETGILAPMDDIWNSAIPDLKQAARKRALENISGSISFVGKKDFWGADEINHSVTSLNNTIDIVKLARDTNNFSTLRTPVEGRKYEQDNLYVAELNYAESLLNSYKTLLSDTQKNSTHVKYVANLRPRIEAAAAIESSNQSYVNQMIDAANLFAQYALENDNNQELATTEYNKASEVLGEKNKAIDEAFSSFNNLNRKNASIARQKELEQWLVVSKYLETGCVEISSRYTTALTKATDLLNLDGKPNTETGLAYSWPSESIPVMQDALSALNTDKTRIQTQKDILLTAPAAQVQENPDAVAYKASIATINECLANLDRVNLAGTALVAQARQRVIAAERAKNEADLRYTEASNAMKRENFQAARDFLQRARTRYNDSLALQESTELRKNSDDILAKLGTDINKAENDLVVRDVRRLTTNARRDYYNGNFEQAENLLVQAKARWNTTNIDDDPEIATLFTLVNTALSMKTGRVIPPTAPLYPEMSQLLNIANQYYDQGRALMKQNKTEEANQILNQARQNINQIKLVYPINQEASLLSLRIDQVINEKEFNSMFEQKVLTAKNDIKNKEKQQTAYTDLLDLYEINPKFPGLKTDIYNAEITLGIRLPPPNPASLRRSKTLTAEVQTVLNKSTRTEIELTSAMSKINEALKLDPDNQTAMQTKDRLSSLVGGTLSVVLSAADESTYNRAIQELSNGNTIQASALVAQLLQKKENQNSYKILDLKKKVDSLL